MPPVRISLCRGCCCGTTRKRPDVDHDGQLVLLDEAVRAGSLTWRTTDCLGPCEEANVLVVQPTPEARRAGARPLWLGRLDEEDLETVISWVAAGGPGRSPVPRRLARRVIPPERR